MIFLNIIQIHDILLLRFQLSIVISIQLSINLFAQNLSNFAYAFYIHYEQDHSSFLFLINHLNILKLIPILKEHHQQFH